MSTKKKQKQFLVVVTDEEGKPKTYAFPTEAAAETFIKDCAAMGVRAVRTKKPVTK